MIDGLSHNAELVTLTGAACMTLAAFYKWAWFGKSDKGGRKHPGWLKGIILDARAFKHVVLGREPIYDSIERDRVRVPALPGIGERMEAQEVQSATTSRQIAEMTTAVTTIANTHQQMIEVLKVAKEQGSRLESLEHDRDDHSRRLDALEAGTVERIVSRAESTAAWRAVEAAHNATPDHIDADPEP